MNLEKKILIVGSNFGFTHYKILKKNYDFKYFVYSPNVSKKNNLKNLNVFSNLKFLKTYKKYHTIVCCTSPLIQKSIVNLIIKKKIICDHIMLEKPLFNDPKFTKKLVSHCLKNKIKLRVNFNYVNLLSIKKVSNYIKLNDVDRIVFTLQYYHYYLKKKNNSWKNFIKDGGGIINYYLIHILFLFINVYKKIKILNIIIIKNKNNFSGVKIILKSHKDTIIEINNEINKKKIVHKYEIYNKDRLFVFFSNKDNWYKSYRYIKFKKKKKISERKFIENFESSILQNYNDLFKNYNRSILIEYYKSLIEIEKICKNLNKKLVKYDFKKM